MPATAMKGTLTAILAAAGIAILLLTVNTVATNQKNSVTLEKNQAARETVLAAENLVRVLDKAAAYQFYRNKCLNESVTISAELDKDREAFLSKMSELILCDTGNFTAVEEPLAGTTGKLTVSGFLTCLTEYKNYAMTETRSFRFTKISNKKTEAGITTCWVKDEATGCTEQKIELPLEKESGFDPNSC